MADWLKPFAPAVRGRALVRTPPVLARYLDDLAQQARLAQPAEPLADALSRNDRTRALVQGRLDRLAPEQRPGSLGLVARQYGADQAAERAAEILYGRDLRTAAALAGAGVLGGGAMYGRMSQLAEEAARGQAENDFDLGPDLSGNPDGAMPMTMDLEEDALMDSVTDLAGATEIDFGDPDDPAEMLASVLPQHQPDDVATLERLAGVPQFAGGQPVPRTPPGPRPVGLNDDGSLKFGTRPWVNLDLPSPDDAVAAAPGPSIPVGRNMDMETLPGPQMRSVRALINAGIPAGRAMDIITKGASMSPDEYRMVTGGRR